MLSTFFTRNDSTFFTWNEQLISLRAYISFKSSVDFVNLRVPNRQFLELLIQLDKYYLPLRGIHTGYFRISCRR